MKGDMRRNQKELGIPAFGSSCFKGCSIINVTYVYVISVCSCL